MVGAINPNATQTLAKQRQLASQASFMLQPGDSWPAEASMATISPDRAAVATRIMTAIRGRQPQASDRAVAGVVLGALLAFFLAFAALWIRRILSNRLKRRGREQILTPATEMGTIRWHQDEITERTVDGDASTVSLPEPPISEHPAFQQVPQSTNDRDIRSRSPVSDICPTVFPGYQQR